MEDEEDKENEEEHPRDEEEEEEEEREDETVIGLLRDLRTKRRQTQLPRLRRPTIRGVAY